MRHLLDVNLFEHLLNALFNDGAHLVDVADQSGVLPVRLVHRLVLVLQIASQQAVVDVELVPLEN